MKDGVAAIKVKRLDTLKSEIDRNSSDESSLGMEEVKEETDGVPITYKKSSDEIAFERRLSQFKKRLS